MEVLKNRSDFLRAAKAHRHASAGFVLQGRKRDPGETPSDAIRIGFTCSKKVGNAVARNRAKRRLREIARTTIIPGGLPGWDYVLIGRFKSTAELPMADLNRNLKTALTELHRKAT